MISFNESFNIAEDYLIKRFQNSDNPPVIILNQTIETEKAWIFFYNSKRFIENNDEFARYVGGGPLAILKNNGEIIRISPFVENFDEFLSSY
ncbi:YrhB domain-containing protein [Emticicia agri]|uniref:Immunity protein 35 domain-containing protein n=1 Tax=Emticicia agri TaxID=2492393 RepID=A0A4Q5LNV3_9BACT|nr:YrhB domain-containing protein [Emticicia agri]RYU91008.1 hypothetical protein EWM59_27310 [Emticicia agri]RYU91043.1 hypothetical protein EWM59_27110 [Emticicia agri]